MINPLSARRVSRFPAAPSSLRVSLFVSYSSREQEKERERETLKKRSHITPDQADAAFCALYTDNLLDHTRARAADPERIAFSRNNSRHCSSAWDANCPRDVILREFTVSLARRHVSCVRLPTAGCVIHRCELARVSELIFETGGEGREI